MDASDDQAASDSAPMQTDEAASVQRSSAAEPAPVQLQQQLYPAQPVSMFPAGPQALYVVGYVQTTTSADAATSSSTAQDSSTGQQQPTFIVLSPQPKTNSPGQSQPPGSPMSHGVVQQAFSPSFVLPIRPGGEAKKASNMNQFAVQKHQHLQHH